MQTGTRGGRLCVGFRVEDKGESSGRGGGRGGPLRGKRGTLSGGVVVANVVLYRLRLETRTHTPSPSPSPPSSPSRAPSRPPIRKALRSPRAPHSIPASRLSEHPCTLSISPSAASISEVLMAHSISECSIDQRGTAPGAAALPPTRASELVEDTKSLWVGAGWWRRIRVKRTGCRERAIYIHTYIHTYI